MRSVCKTPIAVTDPTAVTTWSAQASINVLDMSDVFIHKAIRNLTIYSDHLFSEEKQVTSLWIPLIKQRRIIAASHAVKPQLDDLLHCLHCPTKSRTYIDLGRC